MYELFVGANKTVGNRRVSIKQGSTVNLFANFFFHNDLSVIGGCP